MSCEIDVHVPLRAPDTGFSLGTLHVQAGFVGSVTVNIALSSFAAHVTGGFEWDASPWTVPSFTIHTPWPITGDLVERIEDEIRKKGQVIFAALLTDAHAYFRLVANHLVEGEQNVLRLAKDVFSLNYVDTLNMLAKLDIQVDADPYNVLWFRKAVPALLAAKWTPSQLSGAAKRAGVSLAAFMDGSIGNTRDPAALAKDAYAVFSGDPNFANIVTTGLAGMAAFLGPGAPTAVATMIKDAGLPAALMSNAFAAAFPGAAGEAQKIFGGIAKIGGTIGHAIGSVFHSIFHRW